MRKKIVAGNWKMNLTIPEGEKLINDIINSDLQLKENEEVIFAPPFTHLQMVQAFIKDKEHLLLSAQNCHVEKSGAYTGEISAEMLVSVGASFVILGHSERREYFKEDNYLLAKKLDRALEVGLQPIFCCGESLDIRDAGSQNNFVTRQLEDSLFHLSEEQLQKVVIAYEPIWAIGTGRTASTQQAQEMHAHIRSLLKDKYGEDAANDISILYGGSVKPANAKELFACEDVDGGLVGGASLKAADFTAIINSF